MALALRSLMPPCIWSLSYNLFPFNVCPSFCPSAPFSDVSASCFRSWVDWKVCPVGYTLSNSSMMYYAWLKWLSLICTIAPINLLIIDLHHFCWKSSTRPLFCMCSQKLRSNIFLPYHLPCLISLPFVVIHLSLLFFLPLPPTVLSSFCFFSILLHISPLPASLPPCFTAANKSTMKG